MYVCTKQVYRFETTAVDSDYFVSAMEEIDCCDKLICLSLIYIHILLHLLRNKYDCSYTTRPDFE